MQNGNIGYLLNQAAKSLKYELNTALEREGFTASQWAVLKHLELLGLEGVPVDRYTAVSIGERLDMDKPTMSGIVKRLVEKGALRKLSHPTDKRASVLELTEETREVLPVLERISEQALQQALNGFTEADKRQFIDFLLRMNSNLKKGGNEHG